MSKRFLALICIVGALLACSSASAATVRCDLVAAPIGSDSAAGTAAAPLRTVQRLVNLLQPGQTGCLRTGSYSENVKVAHGGTAGAPLTLTSYPGETAQLAGRLWIAQGSDNVTVTGLGLDGRNSQGYPSPTINANYATFSYDNVTNEHTAICFMLGSSGWGSATGTFITHTLVHGCGVLPAQNQDHGIYVALANNTRIEWNLIYDNADRGIQLYPNAQNTTIDHNVIDGNGEGVIFSGDYGTATSNTDLFANIITNSQVRHDVESWYPTGNPVGRNNFVHGNCIWGGRQGTIDTSAGGFTATGNTIAPPQYQNALAHDYRLSPTSPCLRITGDIAAAVLGGSVTHVTQPGPVTQPGRVTHPHTLNVRHRGRLSHTVNRRRHRHRSHTRHHRHHRHG